MKSILILEDNKHTLDALAIAVQEVRNDLVIFPVQTLQEAYLQAFTTNIDLFLLDIILTTEHPGDTSGFQFAQKLRQNENYKFTPIIFITSLEDQKYYAYSEIHSYFYLEKPFSMPRVKELVEETLQFPGKVPEEKKLYVRKEGILYQIQLKKTIYVECINHKLRIYMTDGELEVPYYTIKWFLKETNDPAFCQCSRNVIINKQFLESIDLVNRYVRMKGTERLLDLGPAFKKKFLKESFYE